MTPAIDLAIEHDSWGSAGDDLDRLSRRAVEAALAVAADAGVEVPGDTELSLLLCDDAAIRRLNRQWRGKDKPTNVLSFPAPEAMRAYALGDIAVAYETSAAEAGERGVPLADHLAHLVVHGVFHLLDFDHGDDAEAERMEGLEARALASLGLASPFADERAEPDEAAPTNPAPGAAALTDPEPAERPNSP